MSDNSDRIDELSRDSNVIASILGNSIGRIRLANEYGLSQYDARRLIKTVKGYYDPAEEQFNQKSNQINVTEEEEGVSYEYKGERPITSKEDAVEYFNIDLNRFYISKFNYKAFDVSMKIKQPDGTHKPIKRTNYSAHCETRIRENQIDYEKLIEHLKDKMPNDNIEINHVQGTGTGVAHTADWHTGAKTDITKDVIRTEDFDLNILQKRVNEMVNKLNAYKFQTVDISILGDLIESLTGLNHINSFQSMQENIWGGSSIKFAYIVIRDMLRQINNLRNIYIVSGNHDRSTKRNDEDVKGTVAETVAFFLKEAGFNVHFHPLVLTTEIDNIHYVFTHNHFKFAQKDLYKIFYEYGKQGLYNVLVGGHWHARSTRKPIKDYESVPVDSVDHRAITVPPLFTGNFYSESLGYTSSAGFGVTYAAENSKNIYHHDIPLV